MEDFSTRTYGTSGLDNRPLFGETSAKPVSIWMSTFPVLNNHKQLVPPYLLDSTEAVGILLCCLEISDSSWLPHLNLFTVFFLWDRIINLVVGSLTSLLILVTLISAFVFPQLPPKPLNIFFAVCISLSSITACILIYWYRQGDLEPKFRNLIYYILFSIIMLCICANLYFHDVGR